MQLRRFLTGLTAAFALALISFSAGATTRFSFPYIDELLGSAGQNGLICIGTVMGRTGPITVTIPGKSGGLQAFEYTINCSEILKGNAQYPAPGPATVKVKMVAGLSADFPNPVEGENAFHVFYGPSQYGLTSYVGGPAGKYVIKEVDGQVVAISAAGQKGFAFKNQSIQNKFMQFPGAGKFLRTGPAIAVPDSADGASKAPPTLDALKAVSTTVWPMGVK